MSFNRGKQLKMLRLEKGYSQRELAKRVGLTSGFISQIEQNKSNPSIETLRRILNALNSNMAKFYTQELESSLDYFFKPNDLINIGGDTIEYWLVAARFKKRKMDFMREIYPPMADTGILKHSGHEAGFIISGSIELTVGDEKTILETGDSYYFESRIPHRFKNIGDIDCEIISANTPPSV